MFVYSPFYVLKKNKKYQTQQMFVKKIKNNNNVDAKYDSWWNVGKDSGSRHQ